MEIAPSIHPPDRNRNRNRNHNPQPQSIAMINKLLHLVSPIARVRRCHKFYEL